VDGANTKLIGVTYRAEMPSLAIDPDFTIVGLQDSAENPQQRALSSAVFTDDRDNLAATDG
jgi:hypothetical protein